MNHNAYPQPNTDHENAPTQTGVSFEPQISEELPVCAFKDQIMGLVANNPVTIIQAETGAGKTTQIPQFLMEAGYPKIAVTQPRRVAARTVAERIAEELGEEVGQTVGYAMSGERETSQQTRCTILTDGLKLVQELYGSQKTDVLVLDEVHEANMNTEILLAWAKRQMQEREDLKLVVMSATLDSEPISEFFESAPVVSVPGRQQEITDMEPGYSIEEDALKFVKQGKNILIFQPGKKEIEDTIKRLAASNPGADILPLHGQLDSSNQKLCFKTSGKPKIIVATNVAQTSITIPDIDVVLDSGLERRLEIVDGVEQLALRPISVADSQQRRGRAGRTKPGIYIDYHDPSKARLRFPVPEIRQTRLDTTMLRLARSGVDMMNFEFLNQPATKELATAREELRNLELLDEHGRITDLGKQVAELPVEARYGRMLVEASKLGVAKQAALMVAIAETGGILDRKSWKWWASGLENETSDLIAQFKIAEKLFNSKLSNKQKVEQGIHVKSLRRAKSIYGNILGRLKRSEINLQDSNQQAQDDLLRRVLLVGHQGSIYFRDHTNGQYRNVKDDPYGSAYWSISRSSVVYDKEPQLVVGNPFTIDNGKGKRPIRLIDQVTATSVGEIAEHLPHLVTEGEAHSKRYNPEADALEVRIPISIGYFAIGNTVEQLSPDHPLSLEYARQQYIETARKNFTSERFTSPQVLTDSNIELSEIIVEQYSVDPDTGEPLYVYITPSIRREYGGGAWLLYDEYLFSKDEASEKLSSAEYNLKIFRKEQLGAILEEEKQQSLEWLRSLLQDDRIAPHPDLRRSIEHEIRYPYTSDYRQPGDFISKTEDFVQEIIQEAETINARLHAERMKRQQHEDKITRQQEQYGNQVLNSVVEIVNPRGESAGHLARHVSNNLRDVFSDNGLELGRGLEPHDSWDLIGQSRQDPVEVITGKDRKNRDIRQFLLIEESLGEDGGLLQLLYRTSGSGATNYFTVRFTENSPPSNQPSSASADTQATSPPLPPANDPIDFSGLLAKYGGDHDE